MRGIVHGGLILGFVLLSIVAFVAEVMACIQWLGLGWTIVLHVLGIAPGLMLGTIACFVVGWWYVPVAYFFGLMVFGMGIAVSSPE